MLTGMLAGVGMYHSHDANYHHQTNYVVRTNDLAPVSRLMAGSIDAVMGGFERLRQHAALVHTEAFLAIDVTMSQAQLLYVVSTRPNVSMSVIAAQLHIRPPAVSGLVDRLVDHGYLQRREDPNDRRQQLVTATPAGLEVVDKLRELDDSYVRGLLSGLSSDELDCVGRGLQALAREAALQTAARTAQDLDDHPERKPA